MIGESEFFEKLTKLERWTKPLKDEQRLVLYEQLKNIPREALDEIVDGFIDSLRPNSPFPAVRDFREAWIEWLQAHPEKVAWEYEKQYCPECEDKGYFEVVYDMQRTSEGHVIEYTTLLPCAYCRNWKRTWGVKPKKMWTLEEINRHPRFYLKGEPKPAKHQGQRRRNITELANKSLKGIDDVPF